MIPRLLLLETYRLAGGGRFHVLSLTMEGLPLTLEVLPVDPEDTYTIKPPRAKTLYILDPGGMRFAIGTSALPSVAQYYPLLDLTIGKWYFKLYLIGSLNEG